LDLKNAQPEAFKMSKYDHYIFFADLLRYPESNFPEVLEAGMTSLQAKYPEAVEELQVFADFIRNHTADEREELYTKTFDVQPICYLDLGYVIFGEDYKRGAFLLHMQGEQQAAGNDCGTDLADNISNMLTLFTKTSNQQIIDELAVKILIPGVEKMIAEFAQARVDLKVKVLKKLHRAIIQEELNQGNVYRNVFTALLSVLKKDFQGIHFESVLNPVIDLQHHKSFFGKQSVNVEVNNLVSNYKLD